MILFHFLQRLRHLQMSSHVLTRVMHSSFKLWSLIMMLDVLAKCLNRYSERQRNYTSCRERVHFTQEGWSYICQRAKIIGPPIILSTRCICRSVSKGFNCESFKCEGALSSPQVAFVGACPRDSIASHSSVKEHCYPLHKLHLSELRVKGIQSESFKCEGASELV